MTPVAEFALEVLDTLDEGVLFIEQGMVRYVNRAAALFLDSRAGWYEPLPLIHVVRDHRLERAYLEQTALELFTRGRTLFAKPVAAGLLLKDVSEVKWAQESARELLAVLSHELRTPVTAISSTLEALRYTLPDAQRTRFLDLADTEAKRLVRLLEDLTVDVKPPSFRRIDLREVAERAEHVLEDRLKEHGIALTTDLPEVSVWSDADKLLQVLINLLENAAHYGPDQGRVRLLARASEAQPGFLEVAVQDEGEPLEPGLLEKLFDPHTRANETHQGTGLGLFIVRSIVARWGGVAWGRPLAAGNEFGFSVAVK